ncbi:MAG: Dna2/Cas4 domain-containing protein [Methanotrichaceae archaeon]
MPPLIRISDIGLYLRCPRLNYFDALGTLPRKTNPEQILLRSIMLSISSEYQNDIEGNLNLALTRLLAELPLIYETPPKELEAASENIRAMIPEIAAGLSSHIGMLLPSVVEVDLRSDKIGLSGRLDRLVSGCIPSIIRTGSAPVGGVWKRDRLMLAGYALMLGEKCGAILDRGRVEYPRTGEVREIQIHSIDRVRVLRIRDRIQQIKDGQLPDRPEDASCDNCTVRERCETRYSLASKFF